jgi:hypothetical protein
MTRQVPLHRDLPRRGYRFIARVAALSPPTRSSGLRPLRNRTGGTESGLDDRGYGRFQGRGADANPSLEMARAGLEHHARLMAIGPHKRQHISSGVIQIEENIAGIAMLGVGEKIDVIT